QRGFCVCVTTKEPRRSGAQRIRDSPGVKGARGRPARLVHQIPHLAWPGCDGHHNLCDCGGQIALCEEKGPRSKIEAYSITSSARTSSVGGISRPIALAVLRLIMR